MRLKIRAALPAAFAVFCALIRGPAGATSFPVLSSDDEKVTAVGTSEAVLYTVKVSSTGELRVLKIRP